MIALMMEAASTYDTSRRRNPEDSHLHTRRRENLKIFGLPNDAFSSTYVHM
jgi:hypothetical protein